MTLIPNYAGRYTSEGWVSPPAQTPIDQVPKPGSIELEGKSVGYPSKFRITDHFVSKYHIKGFLSGRDGLSLTFDEIVSTGTQRIKDDTVGVNDTVGDPLTSTADSLNASSFFGDAARMYINESKDLDTPERKFLWVDVVAWPSHAHQSDGATDFYYKSPSITMAVGARGADMVNNTYHNDPNAEFHSASFEGEPIAMLNENPDDTSYSVEITVEELLPLYV